MVVFDFFGSLNGGVPELAAWIGDPGDQPTPRPGAAEVATAYREHGYELLYLTLVPIDTVIGDVPILDAVTAWLALNGFPAGSGAQVWAWDGQGSSPVVRAIDELVRLSTEGVSIDAGYTDNVDKANALLTGGVPTDRLFTMGAAAGQVSSSSIPGGDLAAHVATVEALERVCQPG